MDQAQQLRNIVKARDIVMNAARPFAKVYAVTSGKGGTGKSTTSINLAIQFRQLGKRVVILDADFGLANIEIMFGIRPQYTLLDMVKGRMNIQDIITHGPMDIGFISGGSGIVGMRDIGKDELSYIIGSMANLDGMADVVIVDTGAGISDSVLDFLVAGAEILLVSTPEPTAIADSYSLLKAMCKRRDYDSSISRVRFISNRVDNEKEGLSLYNKIAAVVGKYLDVSFSYLGPVSMDKEMHKASMSQNPVSISNPNAASSKQYAQIAAALMDIDPSASAASSKRGIAGFFSNLLNGR